MYCQHCHSKLEDAPAIPVRLAETNDGAAARAVPPSKKNALTRLSVIACSLLLLLLALTFFVLSVRVSNVHQVMLMGLGLLLLGACEVVWTARTRKAVIGSFVVAGAGVALVSVLIAVAGAAI